MLTSSVVVPILNAARTLPACLRALDRLRPAPDQVILVDNGSTDESLLLAKTFAGESHPFRVQLLCAAPRGASTARNTGIKAAGGEISPRRRRRDTEGGGSGFSKDPTNAGA